MFRFRILAAIAFAASLAALPSLAAAHTELTSSNPADGATLSEAPSEVVLTFEGELGGDSSFSVAGPRGTSAGSGSLDLAVAERNILRGDVTVKEAGTYRVAYSIVGEDGDPIEGKVSFTYAPNGSSADVPNTAVVAPQPDILLVLGLALLGLSLLASSRRLLAR